MNLGSIKETYFIIVNLLLLIACQPDGGSEIYSPIAVINISVEEAGVYLSEDWDFELDPFTGNVQFFIAKDEIVTIEEVGVIISSNPDFVYSSDFNENEIRSISGLSANKDPKKITLTFTQLPEYDKIFSKIYVKYEKGGEKIIAYHPDMVEALKPELRIHNKIELFDDKCDIIFDSNVKFENPTIAQKGLIYTSNSNLNNIDLTSQEVVFSKKSRVSLKFDRENPFYMARSFIQLEDGDTFYSNTSKWQNIPIFNSKIFHHSFEDYSLPSGQFDKLINSIFYKTFTGWNYTLIKSKKNGLIVLEHSYENGAGEKFLFQNSENNELPGSILDNNGSLWISEVKPEGGNRVLFGHIYSIFISKSLTTLWTPNLRRINEPPKISTIPLFGNFLATNAQNGQLENNKSGLFNIIESRPDDQGNLIFGSKIRLLNLSSLPESWEGPLYKFGENFFLKGMNGEVDINSPIDKKEFKDIVKLLPTPKYYLVIDRLNGTEIALDSFNIAGNYLGTKNLNFGIKITDAVAVGQNSIAFVGHYNYGSRAVKIVQYNFKEKKILFEEEINIYPGKKIDIEVHGKGFLIMCLSNGDFEAGFKDFNLYYLNCLAK